MSIKFKLILIMYPMGKSFIDGKVIERVVQGDVTLTKDGEFKEASKFSEEGKIGKNFLFLKGELKEGELNLYLQEERLKKETLSFSLTNKDLGSESYDLCTSLFGICRDHEGNQLNTICVIFLD